MEPGVSREEFENTVAQLKAAIETSVVMSTVASTAVGVALTLCEDRQKMLSLLENALLVGESSFGFSPVTDLQLKKYQEYCSVLLNNLRLEK